MWNIASRTFVLIFTAAVSLQPASIGALRHRAVRHPGETPAPVAAPDSFDISQNILLSVPAPGVLANDTVNGATITSYGGSTGSEQTSIGSNATTAQGGTVELNSDGSLIYNPSNGFAGVDTFKYVLTNAGGTSTATVTITVTLAPPAAVADSYNTSAGTALNVPAPGVLGNDTLNGATIVSYGPITGSEQTSIGASTATAKGGTVAVNSDGSFAFRPASGFSGNDTFVYMVQNSSGSSTATVTIAVSAPTGPDFTVTSPGFFYSFSGVSGNNPVITLTRGRTYTFQIDTSSIHPFEICSGSFPGPCLAPPAGSVTNNNISNGTITFTVPTTAQTFFYQCSIHFFGNNFQTVP